jgi:hypothetical protein
MKKFIVTIMLLATTWSQVACAGAQATAEQNAGAADTEDQSSERDQQEDEAGETATLAVNVQNDSDTVYTVSGKNMFGLEKLTISNDRVIAVFDKKKFDDELPLTGLKEATDAGKAIAYVGLGNLSTYKNTESYYEEAGGKYVVTAIFSYEESDKISPDLDVTAGSLNVLGRRIVFTGEKIEAYYEISGGECVVVCSQTYDDATGKWSDVSEDTVLFPLEESN